MVRPRQATQSILALVRDATRPPYAREIYTILYGSGQRTGFASVYRELHRLEGAGLISAVLLRTEAVYVPVLGARQTLIVCRVCGNAAVGKPRLAYDEEFLSDGQMVVVGICMPCAAAALSDTSR
jgi:Fe2+ or Zn2+ uptake regulation protein